MLQKYLLEFTDYVSKNDVPFAGDNRTRFQRLKNGNLARLVINSATSSAVAARQTLYGMYCTLSTIVLGLCWATTRFRLSNYFYYNAKRLDIRFAVIWIVFFEL